jgi:hypothetical protein
MTTPTGSNTIEHVFIRPDQTGWGTTTDSDGVPNVTSGMDGRGAKSVVTIGNTTGVYGYPSSINVVGIASSGSTTYNGGDSLVKFAVSAVGHVTPCVVQNACSDGSCLERTSRGPPARSSRDSRRGTRSVPCVLDTTAPLETEDRAEQ